MRNTSLPPTARSLPIALMRARECVMAPIREMLSESGLTEQQWRVLRVLSECGPLDGATLAERASLLPPSLTRITQTMHGKGLIGLAPAPTDRRRQIVAITAAGQQIITNNLPRAVEIAQSYRAKLGLERFELLLDLLEDLHKAED